MAAKHPFPPSFARAPLMVQPELSPTATVLPIRCKPLERWDLLAIAAQQGSSAGRDRALKARVFDRNALHEGGDLGINAVS